MGFSNGFYLSTDAVITTADTYLDGNSNAALAAGATFTWGAPSVTIPAGTPNGSYYIGILVDRTNAVCESTETNNYKSVPITVGPSCTTSDLVIESSVAATPTTVSPPARRAMLTANIG